MGFSAFCTSPPPNPFNQSEYTDCTAPQEEVVIHFMLPALTVSRCSGVCSLPQAGGFGSLVTGHPPAPSAVSLGAPGLVGLGNDTRGPWTPRQFPASVFPASLTFFPGSAPFVFSFSMAIDD